MSTEGPDSVRLALQGASNALRDAVHGTTHLPPEDGHHIAMMLRVSGRATR